MVEVAVCVGSSCHLKGAYQVIQSLQELVTQEGLDEQICLAGSFCLGSCGQGVTVRVGDTLYSVADLAEVRELFERNIKPRAGV